MHSAQSTAVIVGLVLTSLSIIGIGVAVVRHLSKIEFSAERASQSAAAVAESVADLAATVARIAERQQEHGEELAVVKALVWRDTARDGR